MPTHRAYKKSNRPSRSPLRFMVSSESVRIRNSMRKWLRMDETAELLGRGLGRRELIGRVAREVGVSLRRVRAALGGGKRGN